ncbi:protein transport protein SEC31 [Rhodamnia argentea]|uniref:Protein transport protein SEC31 n=1 Tax=Rhodamnia argentea TaxID=178133 RepID=A0A8B8P1D0_9MYRT|nr:protein transport protein SEC31 [Rhodamnia argentea]
MIKTLSPYSSAPASTAKTAEIMSRYRPIAPKPETVPSANSAAAESPTPSSMSPKIRQSPYLRSLWPQLQARPTRTRKRGRTAISPPAIKRPKAAAALAGIPPPYALPPTTSLSLQVFTHGLPHIPLAGLMESPPVALVASAAAASSPRSLVTLPLLPCSPELNCMNTVRGEEAAAMDLNVNSAVETIPEEKDLLRQLQGPASGGGKVISPRPVRPVGSSITVGRMSEDRRPDSPAPPRARQKPEEVEEEVESEALPAVISDSNNRVRVVNSAYKEMVGQPECPWLEAMGGRRIGGEVAIRMCDEAARVPAWADGFSCWARIEWVGSGGEKSSVKAFCDAIRLRCESKDYLFTWRFHTNASSESSSSAV